MGLRGRIARQRRTWLQSRRRIRARDRDIARQRRADQRGALLRRPRPSRDLDARGHDGGRSGPMGSRCRRDRSRLDALCLRPVGERGRVGDLQEQLRRQGQLLRVPRELPRRPEHAVRADRRTDHPPLRHPSGVLRRRKGGLRTARSRTSRGAVPDQSASRLLRGGGRARDHPQAPDREHPRRTALRSVQVPAAARDRR